MQLHEQTRRFISLCLFYFLGPMLTIAIIGGIVLRKLPNNARNIEYAMSIQTGLHWTVESIEYYSPSCVRLHKPQLIDDTNTIFVASYIDFCYVSDNKLAERFPNLSRNKTPEKTIQERSYLEKTIDSFVKILPQYKMPEGFWQISIPAALIKLDAYTAAESASAMQQLLNKLTARCEFLSEAPVQISIEKILINSEYSHTQQSGTIDTLRFVQGNLYQTQNEVRSDWTFQLKDVSEVEMEQLSFSKGFVSDSLGVSFRTGKQALPCDLLAVFCPIFNSFTGGTFAGEMSFTKHHNAQQTELKNVLIKNLDIAPFAKRLDTSFSVQGTLADLQISHAVFGSTSFDADGCFLIKDGSIDANLFHQIVDKFRLTVEPSSILESPRQLIPFSECALHFKLQPDGAAFWADERWKNMFMYKMADADGNDKMIVSASSGQRQKISYHAILSIFAPDAAPVVPLTPGLQKVFMVIPVEESPLKESFY